MGHAKEIITMDVYGDNREIIEDCVPELSDFMDEVLPDVGTANEESESLLDIMPDVDSFIPSADDDGEEEGGL